MNKKVQKNKENKRKTKKDNIKKENKKKYAEVNTMMLLTYYLANA